MYKLRLRFHWSLFPRVELTISQHWFRYRLGAGQATSHYLNQWWLVYWRIYASLSLNELTCHRQASLMQSNWISWALLKPHTAELHQQRPPLGPIVEKITMKSISHSNGMASCSSITSIAVQKCYTEEAGKVITMLCAKLYNEMETEDKYVLTDLRRFEAKIDFGQFYAVALWCVLMIICDAFENNYWDSHFLDVND